MEGISERYVSNAYFTYVFSALLNMQDNHYKMLHKIYRSLSTLEWGLSRWYNVLSG